MAGKGVLTSLVNTFSAAGDDHSQSSRPSTIDDPLVEAPYVAGAMKPSTTALGPTSVVPLEERSLVTKMRPVWPRCNLLEFLVEQLHDRTRGGLAGGPGAARMSAVVAMETQATSVEPYRFRACLRRIHPLER